MRPNVVVTGVWNARHDVNAQQNIAKLAALAMVVVYVEADGDDSSHHTYA